MELTVHLITAAPSIDQLGALRSSHTVASKAATHPTKQERHGQHVSLHPEHHLHLTRRRLAARHQSQSRAVHSPALSPNLAIMITRGCELSTEQHCR
jgi:hypothetical protein